ncbi:contact-dependent growth inhibition system immunity protein [Streptomyces sp. NPDC093249]|uniref:contact-dependent growth inhibition system immunity protein n=1 Tax=unclassified Streptomyces TaxID=2593676 RepID=UPI003803F2EE
MARTGRVPSGEEWRARFPELAQPLGGWFTRDVPDEFGDHGTALADYLEATDPGLLARRRGSRTVSSPSPSPSS